MLLVLFVLCIVVGFWIFKNGNKNTDELTQSAVITKQANHNDENDAEKLQEKATSDDLVRVQMGLYNLDEILRLKNKDFAFKCLSILNEKGKKEEVGKLTDAFFCKNKFDMNYAILQEVSFETNSNEVFTDHCGYRRYYPDVITLFGKKYVVCNDWYYNNKTNTRDTRTAFIRWVLQ